jgi:hypothetical protein
VSTRAGALLHRLVDDAGVFPPRELPVPRALAEHRAHLDGPYSWLIGRFLVPATRLADLQAELGADDRFRVGLVMDTGAAGVGDAVARACEDRRLFLSAVEIPLSPEAEQSAAAHQALKALGRLPAGVSAYVELPRVHGWRDALSLVAARGRGAKLRTGGRVTAAFPTDLELAIFIHACVEEGVPFKCTAGLHHAVRHVDKATGFEHHGFLNILLATCHAVLGGSVSSVADVLALRDPAEVVGRLTLESEDTLAAARGRFVAFGSCSFTEPVDDLVRLGLIERQQDG